METKDLYVIPTTDVVQLKHQGQILQGSDTLYDSYLLGMEEEEDI